MSDATPRLDLPYLAAAQAQKHVTVNATLQRLDALVQCAVVSRSVAAAPAAPSDGQAWIVPPGAASGWPGAQPGVLARWIDGAWTFDAPGEGWLVWVQDEASLVVLHAGVWEPAVAAPLRLDGLEALGVGASADGSTPFVARLNAALLTARPTADGGDGDLRLTLNKEAPAQTGSVLWQDGFVGRAEMGLCGDDHLRLKTSPDGASWVEALEARPDGALALTGGLVSVAGGAPAGLRNLLRNGGLDVWQRGPGPTGPGVLSDGWRLILTGGSTATQVAVPGADSGRGVTVLAVDVTAVGGEVIIRQQIDLPARLLGRRVTLSGWVRGPAGASTSPSLIDVVSTLVHTGDWIFFSVSTELAATLADVHVNPLRFPSMPGRYEVSDIQLEMGPVASAFEAHPFSLELTTCRGYFRRYATPRDPDDLAFEMIATPVASGAGPFDYSAEP